MMNDRFKFRAWDIEEQKYREVIALGQDRSFLLNIGHVRNDTQMFEQCTGLKDKNGKLIYENDIIDTPNGIYRVAVDDFGLWTAIYKGNPLKDVVKWSDIVKNYAFNKENVEIVILGNIHQDKELLDE